MNSNLLYTLITYSLAGLFWGSFSMGMQHKVYSKTNLTKLLLVGIINMLLWPIGMEVAIYNLITGKHDKFLKTDHITPSKFTKREVRLITHGLYILECQSGGDELHYDIKEELIEEGGLPKEDELRNLWVRIARENKNAS